MSPAASVERDEQIRLFVGLRLPGEVLDVLVPWQERALAPAPGCRIVPRGNLHVTLAFLGHRPARELEQIAEALRDAAAAARRPSLTVRRYRETRSVGMLVLDDAEERASRLAGDLHGRLEALGLYEQERRPWLPHLTVVRFRQPPRLHPVLPELPEISPSGAAVYHSVLRRGGAQYEVLESVALGGG